MTEQLETATFGAGCFWCVEAVFRQLRGVKKVVSGYAGGTVEHPTYQAVCSGTTGHAEVVQIVFDPQQITFADLLEIFWRSHNPTTLNRQGADVGSQYRSVIFYHTEQQRALAEQAKRATDASGLWPDPIVTEIVPSPSFFAAESYHQDYYSLNAVQPYCRMVINPKLQKLKSHFAHLLKQPCD